jgi:hypothetical protein
MKHAASRELYAYWQEKRGGRPAPERDEIEPGAIRAILGDMFILTLHRNAGHPVHLAGTRVCALFDREIKGESFLDLWTDASRYVVSGLLGSLSDECTGTVAGVSARNALGQCIDLEVLLLPLGAARPSLARAMGVLAPLKIPLWLGSSPFGELAITGRRHVGAPVETRLLPRFMAPRGRPDLRVQDGGQAKH